MPVLRWCNNASRLMTVVMYLKVSNEFYRFHDCFFIFITATMMLTLLRVSCYKTFGHIFRSLSTHIAEKFIFHLLWLHMSLQDLPYKYEEMATSLIPDDRQN